MIKQIKYTTNEIVKEQVREKLLKKNKPVLLNSLDELEFEKTIDFNKINFISSSGKNNTGKTLIIDTIEYVLNVSKKKNKQRLTELSNEFFTSTTEEETHKMLFIYDVEITFSNGMKIKREIKFVNDKFECGDYYIDNEKKSKKEIKIIIRTIYNKWPKNFHFRKIEYDKLRKNNSKLENPYKNKDEYISYSKLISFFCRKQYSDEEEPRFFVFDKFEADELLSKSLAFSFLGYESYFDLQKRKEIIAKTNVYIKELIEVNSNLFLIEKTLNQKVNNQEKTELAKYISDLREIKENINQGLKTLSASESEEDKLLLKAKELEFELNFEEYKSKIERLNTFTKTLIVKETMNVEELKEEETKEKNRLLDILEKGLQDNIEKTEKELKSKNVGELNSIFRNKTKQNGSDLISTDVKKMLEVSKLLSSEIHFPFMIIDNIADQKDEEFDGLLENIDNIFKEDKFEQYIITNSNEKVDSLISEFDWSDKHKMQFIEFSRNFLFKSNGED